MATNGTTTSPATIPVVDFADFTPSSSPETRKRIADDLVGACREVGFVYIINHGVPADELANAFATSKHFYNLPLEDKMTAPHPPGWAVHRGYSWPGLEKVSNATSTSTSSSSSSSSSSSDEEAAKQRLVEQMRRVQDFKESYEIGSDLDPDMPNIWPPPSIYPAWRPTMTDFYWTCFAAAKPVLRALALGIGLSDEDHLLNLHSGHHNQLRLLHYPSVPARALQEGGGLARMPAHTDWSTITLLFQDEVGGLQVEALGEERGVFIDVPPLEGGMLLNVGDLLMRWSNDYLKSTAHRVTLPPLLEGFEGEGEERMTRERYSIPYFLTTDPDLVIECLTVRDGERPKYEPITRREYYAMRASMQY